MAPRASSRDHCGLRPVAAERPAVLDFHIPFVFGLKSAGKVSGQALINRVVRLIQKVLVCCIDAGGRPFEALVRQTDLVVQDEFLYRLRIEEAEAGRNHAAHRVADDIGFLNPKRVQQFLGVRGHV